MDASSLGYSPPSQSHTPVATGLQAQLDRSLGYEVHRVAVRPFTDDALLRGVRDWQQAIDNRLNLESGGWESDASEQHERPWAKGWG